MKNTIIRFVSMLAIPILLLLYFTFVRHGAVDPSGQQLPKFPPQRIVSFAPSATEMLFELGQGDNVVGVTQFCAYPPAATEKEKIGGNVDHNYEAILRLKPDFAVILKEQVDIKPFLEKHSIPHAAIGSESISEIIDAVQLLSRACFSVKKGDSLAQSLRRQLYGPVVDASATRPKVLFCVSRDDIRSGTITKVFAAGAPSFYNELIEAAGGVNILGDVNQPYPPLSAEAVVRLNPDIIVDISSSYLKPVSRPVCWEDWLSLKSVKGRVHCLDGDYLMIPGPRVGLILRDLKRVIAVQSAAPVRDEQ